ncbi:MAG TPA: damage-inducible protein [Planctomycetaceae bacterium]|nr:damage-inducible protein [Blastopirellula sp.]HAY79943.1 damage-inducible protein [Planctomycetaceae bacterium]
MKPCRDALALADTLQQFGLRIVFAESCTAGLLAASLGAVEGISNYLCGSAVSYRERTKIDWLDVDPVSLANQTAVSQQVAEEMVRGVLQRTPEAHVAAATTGHLGPGAPPAQDGVVFVSVAQRTPNGILVKVSRVQLKTQSRDARQDEAVSCAFGCVQEVLNQSPDLGLLCDGLVV